MLAEYVLLLMIALRNSKLGRGFGSSRPRPRINLRGRCLDEPGRSETTGNTGNVYSKYV